ncbi:MAG: GTPase HflX [Candidatus Krumholzibacteriota bacterium]|nr:GTPase HflX [Candidatus Krumholzibacteriota bacterium]
MTRHLYTPPPETPEERAFLVGVRLPGAQLEDEKENLRELAALAATAGATVVGQTIQGRTRIDGSTYIGEGKVEEIAGEIAQLEANIVVFDDDLSPAQARNIEERLQVNVVDRTEVILDIFARRARTRQARIQVEIAQLTYALPRLRRLWAHLSRQAGGIGTRGPGETQLEVDRRRVRERIDGLERKLARIRRGVEERRKRRGDRFGAAIVGYTNAGKSTMLNRLAGSDVEESGRLFSTLDSTTRRVDLPGGGPILVTDTIGFIRKLPAHLVESFRATLLDVREADLLLHIVDASAPRYEERIETVDGVLGRLGRGQADAPTLLVFNKTDLLDGEARDALARRRPDAILASAGTGEGVDQLLDAIGRIAERDRVDAEVVVPHDDGRRIALVERTAVETIERRLDGDRLRYVVRVRRRDLAILEKAGEVRLLPLGG